MQEVAVVAAGVDAVASQAVAGSQLIRVDD